MGYKDYVELGYYRMQRNSYDRGMVEKFRCQVKEEFVPFVRKLEEKRRQGCLGTLSQVLQTIRQ